MDKSSSKFVCVRCGNVDDVTSTDRLLCSGCGHSVSVTEYAASFVAARRSVTFGFHYTQKFSEQYAEEGEIHTHYSLAPPEGWYVFSAMAVIGGVIGNLAYDVIKTAVKRIWLQRKNPEADCFPTGLDLSRDTDIRVFIDGIRSFREGLPSLPPAVREAILHELDTEIRSAQMIKLLLHLQKGDKQGAAIKELLTKLAMESEPSSPLQKAIEQEEQRNPTLTDHPANVAWAAVPAPATGKTKAKVLRRETKKTKPSKKKPKRRR